MKSLETPNAVLASYISIRALNREANPVCIYDQKLQAFSTENHARVQFHDAEPEDVTCQSVNPIPPVFRISPDS
jgi:hypothetical protein